MLTWRRRLKISVHLAAIVLLGTLMMRPGFAEDAGSGAHGDGKASHVGRVKRRASARAVRAEAVARQSRMLTRRAATKAKLTTARRRRATKR